MKKILSHLLFWREFGNEAKFSLVAVLPLFIAILLPIAYPLFISLTYSNQSVVERSAVILDLDNSAISRDLTLSIDATQGVNITRSVQTLDEGIQAVMSRDADAFLFIPEDFSSRIKRFEQGNLKAYVYATNMMIYASIMTGVQQTVLDKNVEIAIERIANSKGIVGERARNTMDPIQYEKQVLYAPTLAYSSYLCPMLFVLVFHQMGLLILAFSVGFHRERDPEFAKRHLWFIDYFWRYLYYFLFLIAGTYFVFYVICPLFGWPCENPLEMIKLIILLTCCHIPLAIAFASFCRDRYTSFQIILGSTLFFFTLSGYVWPYHNLPEWTHGIMDYLAVEPASSAMRRIAFKGATLSECPAECAKLVRLGLTYLVIGLACVHRGIVLLPFRWLRGRRQKAASTAETVVLPAVEEEQATAASESKAPVPTAAAESKA